MFFYQGFRLILNLLPMNMRFSYIFLLFVVLVSGCSSTTGGAIGGLFPAPKWTDGEIRNDRYYAPEGDFSIALPHLEDTYEYRYMHIKEQFSQESDYVSFGPAATDKSIYRVLIINKVSPQSRAYTEDEAVQLLLNIYLDQLRSYQGNPELISQKPVEVNGLRGTEYLFVQGKAGSELNNQFIIINEKTRILLFGEQWFKVDDNKLRLGLKTFSQSFQPAQR
ncbi:hypothetical protein [uncultured Shewanella sp.]|uniref:hypothetical protein n=1 Tax=uncultured Shewanella sp. TaxID=173975 RepID=UPI00261EA008|nr:hypothetical protein [uncultured Shewanella sp.]